MAKYLRKVRSSRWNRSALPARALVDLSTSDDRLSFYRVEDDKSNLDSIIVALAANCDHISNFGYILIPESELQKIGVNLQKTTGQTPFKEVNDKYHYDAVALSADNVLDIASIMKSGGELDEVEESDALDLLTDALGQDLIPFDEVEDSLAKGILKRVLKQQRKAGKAT